MSNKDLARVVLGLSADVTTLKRDMAKADRTVAAANDNMRRSTEKAAKGMEKSMAGAASKIGSALKSVAAPLLALGAGGTIRAVADIANNVARIGDEAKRAGLGLQEFQELKFVAEQNRVGVDALVDGFKELSLRADEFIVTGGGSAAEAFKRLGYGAEELNQKLQNPNDLFAEIIGKLQGMDRAAQIRIADELFGGTGGEQFVQLISQGEQGIRDTIRAAHDLGAVMSADTIAKAAELDRKFNAVSTTVSTALKGAIVEAAAALDEFLKSLPKSASETFADLTVEIGETKDTLVQLANSAGNLFPELEPQIRAAVVQFLSGKTAAEETKQALLDIAKGRPDLAPIIGDMNGLVATLENVIAKSREAAAAAAAASSDPVGPGVTWDSFQSTFFPKPTTKPGGASSGGAMSEAARQQKAILEQIEALRWEKDAIGLSARELAVANALRQAGAAATDEQRAEIESLVLATIDARAANDAMNASLEQMSQLGQDALRSFIDDLSEGKDAGEAFANVLKNIGSQLLNMGIGALGNALFPGAGGGHIGSTFNFGGRQ